jgi:L-threonylcarbamoyladenylate synthase
MNTQKKTLIIDATLCETHDCEDMTLDALLKAPAEILANGGTVAFPTETVYGLGANALDDAAIKRIYEAKGRPSDNPLIVHIASIDMIDILALEVKPYVRELMTEFWPGPITFVFKKRPEISNVVSGGLDTIAVRMPSHTIAQRLIALSGKPIAAPSANLSGKPSPTTSKYVVEDLFGRVDCIVEGGDCEVGLESTVLDVTGDVPIILRPGKVTQEQIIWRVGACDIDAAIKGAVIDTSGIARSPGMKYRHYAPVADVHVYVGSTSDVIRFFYDKALSLIETSSGRIGIMTFDEDAEVLYKLFAHIPELNEKIVILALGSAKDWSSYGQKLFECLREVDVLGCELVLVRGVEEIGLGGAIMNRLKKASEGKVTRI